MKLFNKLSVSFVALVLSMQFTFASDVWINDLRRVFTNNSAIIYEINIRTFGAQDTNKNGIIDFDEAEESGTFLNAISRLDELSQKGINTIHVMPITPTGKTKALGTAGSLYAASSFDTLNPQLGSKNTALSVKSQAIKFINEAHKRNIRVIIDLPACGSYDLYLQRPELFVKDKSGQPVIPADWTDVRLLNSGTETAVNSDVYNLYKGFVDMVLELGADGIRADVATCKTAKFWKELISYSRMRDPQFMWLAEASDSWTEPVSNYAVFTPYNKLLEAGFDGYYGSFFNLKNFKNGKELTNLVVKTQGDVSKFIDFKSTILSFTTHDEMSPLLINGEKFSDMIAWLNATLPFNSYFVDGFDSGDSYIYMWANKKAFKTYTDDDYYFAHRGKLDIFNFSRQPGGTNSKLSKSFNYANAFKKQYMQLISNGKFIPLRTSDDSLFAYSISNNKQTIVVIGNLNFRSNIEATVYVPKFSKQNMVVPIKLGGIPVADKGMFNVKINAGDTIVLLIKDFEIK